MSVSAAASERPTDVAPVLAFLRCRSPAGWLDAALAALPMLLLDHAALELKAAQQALALIWRYGPGMAGDANLDSSIRLQLVRKLSRLAREELRHFEQVVEVLAARGIDYVPLSASRYAQALHTERRTTEPGRCVDTLLIGAIIEARSCERFAALVPGLQTLAPDVARFYASLLRSEARHFQDYLSLAREIDAADCVLRLDRLLDREAALILDDDAELRFHSGVPGAAAAQRTV
jgi:tRNA-(ms[2]io[6]A)-hydroxylase